MSSVDPGLGRGWPVEARRGEEVPRMASALAARGSQEDEDVLMRWRCKSLALCQNEPLYFVVRRRVATKHLRGAFHCKGSPRENGGAAFRSKSADEQRSEEASQTARGMQAQLLTAEKAKGLGCPACLAHVHVRSMVCSDPTTSCFEQRKPSSLFPLRANQVKLRQTDFFDGSVE